MRRSIKKPRLKFPENSKTSPPCCSDPPIFVVKLRESEFPLRGSQNKALPFRTGEGRTHIKENLQACILMIIVSESKSYGEFSDGHFKCIQGFMIFMHLNMSKLTDKSLK